MRTSGYREVLRLAGLLASVALATSRFGLVAHELVGHGGVALAVGARVTQVQLFWFAGGWIRYELPDAQLAAQLAIAMAGIAIETIAGLALRLAVRGDGLGRRIARAIGLALVVHAAWYLANGAFSGFGDGVLLYRVLGGWRIPVAIAAGAVACAAGFAGAREVLGALAAALPGSRRARTIGTIAALLAALAVNAALAAGELRVRRDAVYTATMQPERDREIARELARWTASQSQPPSAEALAAQQARLERAHPPSFPFAWLLGLATALAVLAGAVRSRPAAAGPIAPRLLGRAAVLAAAGVALVIALDAALT